MGGSGKWLKSLISLKKPTATTSAENERQDVDCKSKKKWKLWRSSSEGFGPTSSSSSSSSKGMKRVLVGGSDRSNSFEFTAAMVTVARVPPRDFMVVRREWAAIRIQTALRGLLARKAFRALKAVVRIQAIFRGRQVRKQAALTLRCMQALVRVQAQIRARSVQSANEYSDHETPTKMAEKGWCDSAGTLDEVRAKLQMRQDGVIKRERAIAYSLSQKQTRSYGSPARSINKSVMPLKHQMLGNNSPGRKWLESWMARKPWENRLREENHTNPSETPYSRKSEDNISAFYSYSSKHDAVEVRKNNVTTKILARPPVASHVSRSFSNPSSGSMYDESSVSTSSTSVSPIPLSSKTMVVDSYNGKPSYMNLTESIKAKQITFRYSSPNRRMYTLDDQFNTKSMPLCNVDTKSTASSNPSYLCKDLYPPVPFGRYNEIKNRHHCGRLRFGLKM